MKLTLYLGLMKMTSLKEVSFHRFRWRPVLAKKFCALGHGESSCKEQLQNFKSQGESYDVSLERSLQDNNFDNYTLVIFTEDTGSDRRQTLLP